MPIHPLAGKPARQSMLVNVSRLVTAYYSEHPDPAVPEQHVAFGSSGHRGSAFAYTFNEAHVIAMTHTICRYRRQQQITGPLFLGRDTHALSEPAFTTALEVLAGNGVDVMIDDHGGYTPTPAISHAILTYNRGRTDGFADGIVITPSHNPPEDGGFKYNPPHGGPVATPATAWIEQEANRLLISGLRGVSRLPYVRARTASTTHPYNYIGAYVGALSEAIDMEAIRHARLHIGIDPLGGAGVAYWEAIREGYGLDVQVVNPAVDPTFCFMPLDWDGKIRMDCSSAYAMANLIGLKDRFDVAIANDTDHDRHGIVTRSVGLMNPNHFLAVAISYLFSHRPHWPPNAAVGKTLVSSSLIDRLAAQIGRRLIEVPVGFKWFVEGLLDGSLGFAGEESAGASFLRRDGTVWTTDKDGIILGLLAAEMMAVTGSDPGELYYDITRKYGEPVYERFAAPATPEQKEALRHLSSRQIQASELAGEPILAVLTEAPGNGAAIGGVKVITTNGWFAARPSGTEDVYKIYAESFRDPDHLRQIQEAAKALIARACGIGKSH
jgi:phosphoglucomutase